ncbi:MAG: flippase-like domain-containing protein [Candidatus Aenigmarchaeota archaeon]|nr:flippase-like domain-containing protein [Candidatus Aenigmarchaeota archaeon]
MKRSLSDIVLFLIAAGLLAALIASSNPESIAKNLSRADLTVVAAALFVTLVIICVKIVRWNILLGSVGIELALKQAAGPYMASLFVSNITPGRVGEPIRSYYLKKSLGHHISKTLPTVVMERIMDLSAVVIFCIFGLFALSTTSNPILLAGIGAMVTGLVVVTGVSLNKKLLNKLLRASYFFLKYVPNIKKLTFKFEKIADNFHSGFGIISKSRQMPLLFMITLSGWLMEFSIMKLAFISIGLDIDFFTIASVASLATVVSLLTFLPGNIGSFEASSAILMSQAVPGLDLAAATSGILIYRFSSLIFALIVTSGSFLEYQRT